MLFLSTSVPFSHFLALYAARWCPLWVTWSTSSSPISSHHHTVTISHLSRLTLSPSHTFPISHLSRLTLSPSHPVPVSHFPYFMLFPSHTSLLYSFPISHCPCLTLSPSHIRGSPRAIWAMRSAPGGPPSVHAAPALSREPLAAGTPGWCCRTRR